MISQGQQNSITLFQTIAEQLAARLKPKTTAYFLPLILLGVLLAFHRRRTDKPPNSATTTDKYFTTCPTSEKTTKSSPMRYSRSSQLNSTRRHHRNSGEKQEPERTGNQKLLENRQQLYHCFRTPKNSRLLTRRSIAQNI